MIKQKDEPFGGIQLIVCGDFLQLPPVTKGEEKRKFCFQVGFLSVLAREMFRDIVRNSMRFWS